MQKKSLQKSHCMWFMWSSYVKLEILFKLVAQFSSIINTETLLRLQKAAPPWSIIQAWSSPSFPPVTIEEDKMASVDETPAFCMVKLNKFNPIHRIKWNSVDRIPAGTLWREQEIMNSKWCIFITYKIEKYILTYGVLHFFLNKYLLPVMYQVLCSCYTEFSSFVPQKQH